jgi:hypothetical protein
MNNYQKAGLKAVREFLFPILIMLTMLAAMAGLGYLIAVWTHSAITGVWVASAVCIVGFYGWMIRDAYRRGVRYAKQEEERESEHARWLAEMEERRK